MRYAYSVPTQDERHFGTLTVTKPLYTTEILRLAASLSEPCELEREDGRAELRSPTCGSRISLGVQLDGERRIERLSMQVHACAFGQAAAALVDKHCEGLTHEEEAGWPDIIVLEPARRHKGRHGAILLPFRALLAAIEAAA